jgi:hypothetical protein
MELTVLERPEGRIASEIRRRYGREMWARNIYLHSNFSDSWTRPDVLVAAVHPDTGVRKLQCGILLIDGGSSIDFAAADCVVSYGMSPRDTITMSSVGDEQCVVALQRELVTVSRRVLERQEIAVPAGNCGINELLAAVGAALLLDLIGIS